jgi:flagellar biosynthesis protein
VYDYKKGEDNMLYTARAIALKYKKGMDSAPKVTAKGEGEVAKAILKKAKEHDIEIQNNPELIELLKNTELDQEIPLEAYIMVAEIFSYLYRVNEEMKNNYSK